jgi:hypothetical protein
MPVSIRLKNSPRFRRLPVYRAGEPLLRAAFVIENTHLLRLLRKCFIYFLVPIDVYMLQDDFKTLFITVKDLKVKAPTIQRTASVPISDCLTEGFTPNNRVHFCAHAHSKSSTIQAILIAISDYFAVRKRLLYSGL